MTNYEYLCNNKLELAKMLLDVVTEIWYDEDWHYDGVDEWCTSEPMEECYLKCSDREKYSIYDEEEAIEHELKWLESEMVEK